MKISSLIIIYYSLHRLIRIVIGVSLSVKELLDNTYNYWVSQLPNEPYLKGITFFLNRDKYEMRYKMNYSQVQEIARETMSYMMAMIKPGQNLIDVRKMCEQKMLELGADSFWYWDIGAFIFSGDETARSVSGRQYQTTDRIIMENDIITIDLSPQWNDIWGDYARTVIIENGIVKETIHDIKNEEWKNSLLMEERLHTKLKEYVTPDTTFEQVYDYFNDLINQSNYVNLDFMGNLGHSIVKRKEDRIYIEKGNTSRLSEVDLFTFEPHISTVGSRYGYKKENIYSFSNNKLIEI